MHGRTNWQTDTARSTVACLRLKIRQVTIVVADPHLFWSAVHNMKYDNLTYWSVGQSMSFGNGSFGAYIFSRVHATLQPALSVGWSVGRSVGRLVGRSVGWSNFTFFYDFISLTSLLLPKWSSDLKYGPCPPAHDFGSCVSSLVFWGLNPQCAIVEQAKI